MDKHLALQKSALFSFVISSHSLTFLCIFLSTCICEHEYELRGDVQRLVLCIYAGGSHWDIPRRRPQRCHAWRVPWVPQRQWWPVAGAKCKGLLVVAKADQAASSGHAAGVGAPGFWGQEKVWIDWIWKFEWFFESLKLCWFFNFSLQVVQEKSFTFSFFLFFFFLFFLLFLV